MVADFRKGSRDSPHGKGEMGNGVRAPRIISTPLLLYHTSSTANALRLSATKLFSDILIKIKLNTNYVDMFSLKHLIYSR